MISILGLGSKKAGNRGDEESSKNSRNNSVKHPVAKFLTM